MLDATPMLMSRYAGVCHYAMITMPSYAMLMPAATMR